MSIQVSNTNKTNAAYSSGNRLSPPNWDKIPHSGMKTPSKEELLAQIKDNGTKMAQAKTEEETNALAYEYSKLRAQYISSVSPDRKALYEDAIQVINQHKSSSVQKEPQKPKSVYDFLNERDGIHSQTGDLANRPAALSSGGNVSASHTFGGGFDYQIQAVGGNVMSSVGNNWVYTQTPMELKKSEEFTRIHDAAYDAAKGKSAAETNGSGNSFDIRV